MDRYKQPATLALSRPHPGVLLVELNRPAKMNAMNGEFFEDVGRVFRAVNSDGEVRCVVVTARGRHFSAGLDLQATTLGGGDGGGGGGKHDGPKLDKTRLAFRSRAGILHTQQCFTAVEECRVPVIAAIHGACIGGGIDLTACCCVRVAAADAYFSIKEVDIGIAADLGTLQRLPRIVGNDSFVRDLAYSARRCSAAEMLRHGYLSDVVADKDAAHAWAMERARQIATKSPVAVTGTKEMLLYARDHTVPDSLRYCATHAMNAHQTQDIAVAVRANLSKGKVPAVYARL